ncbi:MAG: response regulator [Pseudomonadota bacterium]
MTVSLLEELLRDAYPGAKSKHRRRLQVLVLEDDATDRLRLQRVLSRAGLRADLTEVGSVEFFRPALDRQTYDLVFIDFWLGFASGLDALQILLAHPDQARAVPIMLSRATEPDIIVEAMRAGCADYVVKDSLDVETLRRCIAQAFERRIMLAAMREAQELRVAIRHLVDRLASGALPGPADEAAPPLSGVTPQSTPLKPTASARISSGLLADLEMLWHLRRG